MFASAELGHKVAKDVYEAEEPKLRADLLDVQYRVLDAKRFPVVVLIGGVEGGGKSETINTLNEWLDPRHVRTRAYGALTEEERLRPPMWRFWRDLPPKGKVGLLLGSWYTAPIVGRAIEGWKRSTMDRHVEQIQRFESMLAADGVLLVKFWFHLSKKAQRQRLRELESKKKHRWRLTPVDWHYHENYDAFREVSEDVLRATSTGHAPWLVVEAEDEYYRDLTVGRTLMQSMADRLDRSDNPPASTPAPLTKPIDGLTVLGTLDLGQSVSKKKYEKELEELNGRLAGLVRDERFASRSLVLVFEGADAAGKGGAIRRVTRALDARQYSTIPIAAPIEEERAQPYLWRFSRPPPPRGRIAIFDRSWYGRVLVERVEKFCQEDDWMRAYGEISDFEHQLAQHGAVIVKFWLQISPDEQLKRFKEREQTGFKKFKITAEDWRNRDKWDAYQAAVNDMIDRTASDEAKWTIVEANDKNHARLKVLRTICETLQAALDAG